MKKDLELTPESFERLLNWLDSDREKAVEKYERTKLRLMRIFACHGCLEPDTRADDTIDVVISKIDWLIENYVGDPILYFCGVARNVIKEDLRDRAKTRVLDDDVKPDSKDEEEYACLDHCLGQLTPANRGLVLEYYEGRGHTKIARRQRLAEELGITLRALRLRVYHHRLRLRTCIEICLNQRPAH